MSTETYERIITLRVRYTAAVTDLPRRAEHALRGLSGVTDAEFESATYPVVVPPEPTVNRERLIAVATWAAGEQAKAELGLPSEWNQKWWLQIGDEATSACGTACCIAGKVALDIGGIPVIEGRLITEIAEHEWEEYQGQMMSRVHLPDRDEDIPVEQAAREALGLTEPQANALFSADNTLEDVLNVIKQILLGAGRPSRAWAS